MNTVFAEGLYLRLAMFQSYYFAMSKCNQGTGHPPQKTERKLCFIRFFQACSNFWIQSLRPSSLPSHT